MMTKDELMLKIREEWDALMAVVSRLSPEQMVMPDEGGWSPKDNLAHLSEWIKILMGYHMDGRPAEEVAGLTPEIAARWDMEEINPILLQRNRERPAAEVLDELKRVYAELTARLERMSDEDLMKPRREDDPKKSPLINWILGDSADHFEEHRVVIEKSM
jgi:hypothetical protein